jgi:signal peptidase I
LHESASSGGILVLAALLGVWHLCPWRIGLIKGRPQPGEIVVFRHAGVTYVKRIYAVEGETIFFLAEGTPGARTLLLPVSRAQVQRIRAAMGPRSAFSVRRVRVPPGCFFALGDALSGSIDSGDLGPMIHEELIGRAQTLFSTPPVPELELSPLPVRQQVSHIESHRPIHCDL